MYMLYLYGSKLQSGKQQWVPKSYVFIIQFNGAFIFTIPALIQTFNGLVIYTCFYSTDEN